MCCCFCLVAKLCPTLFRSPWTVAHQASLSMGFPRQDTEVGCHFLFQGIFPTQGSNHHFLGGRQILYHCTIQEAHIAQYPGYYIHGLNTEGWDFPGGTVDKNPSADAGDMGSIPGSGRSPGGGNGNPLQYLAWRVPWTEKPGGLQSKGSQRVR